MTKNKTANHPIYNSTGQACTIRTMRTSGTMIVPARISELRRVLYDISMEDLAQLDPEIAAGMNSLLGREWLSARLPLLDSVLVCLFNLEPGGFIVLRRSGISAQIRALVVSPDMRRKGLARTMLFEAEERARDRGIDWLWLHLSTNNQAGSICARSRHFRRYNAQFLRRSYGPIIPNFGIHVILEPVHGMALNRLVAYWLAIEAAEGDSWTQPLIRREMAPMFMPHEGQTWRCLYDTQEVGCVNLSGPHDHPVVTMWLDPTVWAEPLEFACLRAVLNTLLERSPRIEVRLGSAGHLRASLKEYRELGFETSLAEHVVFIKRITTEDDTAD